MLLKGEDGGHVLNGHGKYIVDHGKSWKNHGIVFLNFCANPVIHTEEKTYIYLLKRQNSSGRRETVYMWYLFYTATCISETHTIMHN